MSKLPLTLAIGPYDHVADLVTGRVPVEGIDLNCLALPTIDIFFRFLTYREFDVSEISFAKYASLISQGDRSLTAIPVFPSRVFRHSAIYIRRDGPVREPADLAGCRIGVPEWAETALVYARGALVHQYGVDLAAIDWVQAGVNEPGRKEKVALHLPPGVEVTPVPDKSLSEMLAAGELDAVMAARPPDCFAKGDPNIRRLFEDFVAVEQRYGAETGIFPIMHVVAIRSEHLERNPWIAVNLQNAFEEAKRRSLERALSIAISAFPVPWVYEQARRAQDDFGKDFWPYGVAANRRTLDAFLDYAAEQGVCHRRVAVEELFAVPTQSRARL